MPAQLREEAALRGGHRVCFCLPEFVVPPEQVQQPVHQEDAALGSEVVPARCGHGDQNAGFHVLLGMETNTWGWRIYFYLPMHQIMGWLCPCRYP